MPELPEVETTRRGIEPHVTQQCIKRILVRQPKLRWPIPAVIKRIKQTPIEAVSRRGKYLLLKLDTGTIILHLGMSGSMRVLPKPIPASKHDHVDIELTNGAVLRFTDPRRFGAVLWTTEDPLAHKLLSTLGPEPLGRSFNAKYLQQQIARRKQAIKLAIMNSHLVVGVGNIYANEALFLAGVLPTRPANSLTLEDCKQLVQAIKQVLRAAIRQGGTTLRNFNQSDGKPGYFKQKLKVYGHADEACAVCGTVIEVIRLGQRSTYFCLTCQQ